MQFVPVGSINRVICEISQLLSTSCKINYIRIAVLNRKKQRREIKSNHLTHNVWSWGQITHRVCVRRVRYAIYAHYMCEVPPRRSIFNLSQLQRQMPSHPIFRNTFRFCNTPINNIKIWNRWTSTEESGLLDGRKHIPWASGVQE